MKPHTIRRITGIPVRVPVPVERVNCPRFADHMLQRPAPEAGYAQGRIFFGDVPLLVVKIEGDGGPAGWSDSTRGLDHDEFVRVARTFLGRTTADIDPRRDLVGVEPYEALSRKLGRQVVPTCKCLEVAALDWRARCAGVPLWKLFGEKVRDRLRVEYWSGFRTPEGARQVALEAKRLNFLGLKLKADEKLDVAGVARAVFDAAGKDFHLNLDPNGQWYTVEQALPRAKAMLEASPNVLLEDPIYGDYDAVAEVRRRTGIFMCVTIPLVEWVEKALAADAADGFNLGGSYFQMLQVADAVTKAGKPFWIGSGLDCGMFDAAAIHFGCTQPNCTIGSDLVGNFIRSDDLILQPIRFEHGHALLPDGPGLGVDPDLDAIERLRVGDPIVIQ